MNEKDKFGDIIFSLTKGDEINSEYIKTLKVDEINAKFTPKNTQLLIRNAEMYSDAMMKNIDIAERTDTNPVSVNKRIKTLVMMSIFGLLVFSISLYVLLTRDFQTTPFRLVALITTGSLGVTICSAMGAVYVAWNAFMQKALLEKNARYIKDELVSFLVYSHEQKHDQPIGNLFENDLMKRYCG